MLVKRQSNTKLIFWLVELQYHPHYNNDSESRGLSLRKLMIALQQQRELMAITIMARPYN